MAGKIDVALRALEQAALVVTPFSDLKGRNNVLNRLRLAERALALIAGENYQALARELCGYNNKTASKIAAKYAEICQRSATRRAQGGKKDDYAMSKNGREWVVNSLSFVVPDIGFNKMGEAGFPVGRGLYDSIAEFSRGGETIYNTPPGHHCGRKRLPSAADIKECWLQRSHVVSRTNSQGDNLRVTPGGRAKVARFITETHKCSIATAYNYCPSTVVGSRKHTDLCIYCEVLRKVRLDCVRLANKYGASMDQLGEFSGQGEARSPGNQAASYLKSLADDDEEVTQVLGQLDTLTWHEAMEQTVSARMESDCKHMVVVCFDYSGAVKLTGYRGDANEFFQPTHLTLFGLMAHVPDGRGGFARNYIHVFTFKNTHNSRKAVDSLKCGLRCARKEKLVPTSIREISFYSDKGRHFCSGEMAYGVLFDISRDSANAYFNYHARYRGKTPLDGHFAKVKQLVGEIPVPEWPKSKKSIQKLILGAVNGLPNTVGAFLEDSDTCSGSRRKLVVQDISAAQKFHRFTCQHSGSQTLAVENTTIPVRTAEILDTESDDDVQIEPPEESHVGRPETSVNQMRDKLKKQKRKMARYQQS